MLYRRFGRTNLQMPVFSCGGMRYQHKWQDVPLDQVPPDSQANLEATIRKSVEVGIHHIETARGYGSSERQLGLILPKLPREKLIVQTKIAPQENADQFTREFEESLDRLQLNHVELLALHGINNAQTIDWSLKPNGCLAAARKLQKRGLARHIGFSTHGPLPDILTCIRHQPDGGFDYVNLHWYYILQINWPAILEATQRDMGVFIISPSDKGGLLYKPSPTLTELTQPLHPLVFNDLFCLSHPQVHTLSIGAARPSDFDRHLETLPLLDQADQHLQPILDRLEKRLEQMIPPQLRKPWELNLPTWEQTPQNIYIQLILWLRNLAIAYDMKEYGQMRYNLLGNGGHWFPGRTAEKADANELMEIARQSGLGDQLVPLLQEAHQMLYKAPVKRLSQSD